jgi:hypothetical protein
MLDWNNDEAALKVHFELESADKIIVSYDVGSGLLVRNFNNQNQLVLPTDQRAIITFHPKMKESHIRFIVEKFGIDIIIPKGVGNINTTFFPWEKDVFDYSVYFYNGGEPVFGQISAVEPDVFKNYIKDNCKPYIIV